MRERARERIHDLRHVNVTNVFKTVSSLDIRNRTKLLQHHTITLYTQTSAQSAYNSVIIVPSGVEVPGFCACQSSTFATLPWCGCGGGCCSLRLSDRWSPHTNTDTDATTSFYLYLSFSDNNIRRVCVVCWEFASCPKRLCGPVTFRDGDRLLAHWTNHLPFNGEVFSF